MDSPIAYAVDDKDLDDAALWAVIDSAAAASLSASSTSTSTPKHRTKPLTPIPFPLPSPNQSYQTKFATTAIITTTTPTASPIASAVSYEKTEMRHSLAGQFPTVSLFKEYQNAAMALQLLVVVFSKIHGGMPQSWRKISFYFNLSYEIKDKTIEFDENRNVARAEFIVRAYMQGGRFSDGWGSCERREKRFLKPNHDIPSTAETRAKNRACQCVFS
ncbi:hypothetical protein Sango_1460500 [Sesamum angolense]|uniref:Uncharacterized protein n=1 Tax=Sesamum angolense TaxID=2727404 RepID=A0AAE1WN38_9LAMI|nr:hypothetical protein Sango_1460500 [Sesamum angolense]